MNIKHLHGEINLNFLEIKQSTHHYAGDGYLEGEELLEIVSDMMRKVEIEINMSQLEKLVDVGKFVVFKELDILC